MQKKSFVNKYIKNKYTIIISIVIVAVVLYFIFGRTKPSTFDSTIAKNGDITERVSVTGKIYPAEKADLAFEKGGKVTSIKVKVGDLVKKGDVLASLDSSGDRASLNSALAKLADITRGLNEPEMALEQSKINTASVALNNAKLEAVNASRSALNLTQSVINNYADTLFDNPQSVNPTINIRTPSQISQVSISAERVMVSEILAKWKTDLEKSTLTDDASNIISSANINEIAIKSFMDKLSVIVNDLNTSNSGISRTTIDTYVASINSGLSSLNQAISTITNAKSTLENAISNYDQIYSNYLLKNSGSSLESIQSQRSIVENYKVELQKNNLVSPIDGIVTKVDPDIGEFVSPGNVVFGVISDGNFKIEAYVPEADIAKVTIGDFASTTLDAYGQYVDFPTVVTSVDPAETVLEGVPTYRIVLQFLDKDNRIKSGMTANLDILTNERKNVITIPSRAVITEDDKKVVRIVNVDGKSFTSVPVVLGLKGSDAMIEVISGLAIGDKVVTYIK
jgi:HlyD family secretion protein